MTPYAKMLPFLGSNILMSCLNTSYWINEKMIPNNARKRN
eukprot:CAMPEP_0184702880 /NCGR_PEP_ID=MMETSP0313-20130426/25841_1 /TAXON_ID=2792 /ORGANISM="Porphyridium aerugineum, Strain SAG 1380-2" /LENGTH=39 /DNA_ID= /DNA_START= /DNA_END= /DNA_ORIENTATION=